MCSHLYASTWGLSLCVYVCMGVCRAIWVCLAGCACIWACTCCQPGTFLQHQASECVLLVAASAAAGAGAALQHQCIPVSAHQHTAACWSLRMCIIYIYSRCFGVYSFQYFLRLTDSRSALLMCSRCYAAWLVLYDVATYCAVLYLCDCDWPQASLRA